ncbi:hypothetical protein [Lactobacillus gigeriorum]|uniref:Uncharacterized protein n=1 Tax=Lactobacillus gigeriorum DSM 23908 = CRBIP 24.85 TaxID=1423751 RepID=I7LFV6_9LACO|nr:hypothetical protein [Lactobacillus gigeriorum]CCI87003.1 Protein of unknown function [Lactobacillus gigeriorum DSM 23908 = CRBIP 24.85]
MRIPKRQSQKTKEGLIAASNAIYDPLKKKKAGHNSDRLEF